MSINHNIWVIAPFSRPEFANNIVANFKNQNIQNKKICIIENGRAIGTFKERGAGGSEKLSFKPDLLLSSNNHQSHAKNEGLNKLKNIGAYYWCTFDDDDYYGPNYLKEVQENLNKANITGKAKIFIKTSKNNLWLSCDYKENNFVEKINGPTISGFVSESVYFSAEHKWGEDAQWLQEMKKSGATIYSNSQYNFCLNRSNKFVHTWDISDEQFLQLMPTGVENFGEYDVKIVDGLVDKKPEFIPRSERHIKEHPAYKLLKSKKNELFEEYGFNLASLKK